MGHITGQAVLISLQTTWFRSGEPHIGALAQLGEHLLCKQGVIGSIPIRSTKFGAYGLTTMHFGAKGSTGWVGSSGG